jgi:hypothetical protein
LEGPATQIVPEIADKGNPMFSLYRKAREQNLIDGACKACASKLKAREAIENEDLPLLDEMSGHPGMRRYLNEGYKIIVF